MIPLLHKIVKNFVLTKYPWITGYKWVTGDKEDGTHYVLVIYANPKFVRENIFMDALEVEIENLISDIYRMSSPPSNEIFDRVIIKKGEESLIDFRAS